jgi:hypothetical protein
VATDKSIADLTKDMASHLGDMFRNEIRLARAETVDSAKSLTTAGIQLCIGLAFATAAITLCFLALANAFSAYLPEWAGLAIVGVAAAVTAFILIQSARGSLMSKDMTLPRTRSQIGRDIQNIKEHLPS